MFATMSKYNRKNPLQIRRNRLMVFQPYACIVAENVHTDEDGNENFVKGSKIFCGCCGAPIGILKTALDFPFSFNKFKSSLEQIGFRGKDFFQCQKCQQTLFQDITKIVVTKLENFKKLQIKVAAEKITQGVADGKIKEVIPKNEEKEINS